MKIVVGYDGSDAAKKALSVAQKHAKAFGGKIYIVTSVVGKTEDNSKDMINAKSQLETAIKFVENWRIPCEEHLLTNDMEAGEAIVRFAEEHEADAIIIGVVKQSKVQKFLLGSNAQYVILHSPCMVITVR